MRTIEQIIENIVLKTTPDSLKFETINTVTREKKVFSKRSDMLKFMKFNNEINGFYLWIELDK